MTYNLLNVCNGEMQQTVALQMSTVQIFVCR